MTPETPDSDALTADQKWRIQRDTEREFSTRLQGVLDRWREGDGPCPSLLVELRRLESVATARKAIEDRITVWHANPCKETTEALAESLYAICGCMTQGKAVPYISTRTGLTYSGRDGYIGTSVTRKVD